MLRKAKAAALKKLEGSTTSRKVKNAPKLIEEPSSKKATKKRKAMEIEASQENASASKRPHTRSSKGVTDTTARETREVLKHDTSSSCNNDLDSSMTISQLLEKCKTTPSNRKGAGDSDRRHVSDESLAYTALDKNTETLANGSNNNGGAAAAAESEIAIPAEEIMEEQRNQDEEKKDEDGAQKQWIYECTFESKEELDTFLESEDWWSFRGSEITTQGKKILYRCNRVKRKSRIQCAAGIYIIERNVYVKESRSINNNDSVAAADVM